MSTPRVLAFPSGAEAAAALAEHLIRRLDQAIAQHGRASLALAGGSTPGALYQVLAARYGRWSGWSKLTLLLGDERCVPENDAESTQALIAGTLETAIPGAKLLRAIPGELRSEVADAAQAAALAAAYSAAVGAVLEGRGIDVVLLGMGEDGHTASWFPGPAAPEGPTLYVPVVAPRTSPIPHRITLTKSALVAADVVIGFVTGAKKQARLAQALSGDRSIPFGDLIAARPVEIWADRAASENTMSTNRSDIAVVGLGVMGASLALNMADKGFRVSLYNRTRDKTDELIAGYAHKDRLTGTYDLKGLVESLAPPRKILMMLKAGAPVDDMIGQLSALLSPGDVLIDGGNEFFPNTERRAAEAQKRGIQYVGMGVSGGEEGARHGPSMMPGGAKEAWAAVSPILTKIAAQVSDGPCVTYIGAGGSGHYVKMVHNGIEYGDMQLISEIYDLLKNVGGLDNAALSKTFSEWNKTELESFLIEITSRVFKQKDAETGKDLVDVILDRASMKGTGSWTVEQGAQLGAPIPTIASAVDARVLSSLRAARIEGASRLRGPRPMLIAPELVSALVADARAALYAAKVVSYAQGMSMLRQASDKYGWGLDLVEIARIWKGGCIIRARLLGDIQAALKEPRAREGNLLFSSAFSAALADREAAWRRTLVRAIEAGLAMPALSTSLAYYDTLRRERVPANLIQAQRDLFGAHTYERLDREGSFHTEWGT